MMFYSKEIFFIFAVFSTLCPQCVSSDDTKDEVADTNSDEPILSFERNCVADCDCRYKNEMARGQVHLTCKKGKCRCRNPVEDVRNYSVRVSNDECVVRFNAPCGTTDGITLVCENGKYCIEGRCRSQIRTLEKYFFCDEDIDCREGLKCVEKKDPPIVSYCREPIPPTLTFERECTSDYNECPFQNSKVWDKVYLACKQGKCQCQNPGGIPIQDVPLYDVRVLNGDCVVSYFGPCGTADGVTLVCEEGKFCIEGRCRSQIRSAPKNFICGEDIDCQEGLKCVARDVFPAYNFCEEA